jgi:quinol monooxygenase YgiN
MSVTAIVKLTSLPGQRDALVSAMAPAVEATRAQPACLAADLLAGIENPDELMLVEHWTLGDIMPLLAGELESSHYR